MNREVIEPGRMIGGYRVHSVIGRGGVAVVYRALQVSMGRFVALKVLSDENIRDEAFRERFRVEGRIAANLDHPNVLPVFEAREADGYLFIAMRLVDGPTLADLIADHGCLRWQRALELLAPIASALDAAARAGLVHRDVKPQNILISSGGHPYLADFGLMRLTRTSGLTRTGEWMGTPDYAAPEHMTAEECTSAADVYSLAAVAFHALTGHVPYERASDRAVRYAHEHAPPPRIAALNPRVPERIDEVVASGMAKDPDARPADSTTLIEQLAAALCASAPAAVLVEDVDHPDRSSVREPTRDYPRADAAGVSHSNAVGEGALGSPAHVSGPASEVPGVKQLEWRGRAVRLARAARQPRRLAPAALAGVTVAGALAVFTGDEAARAQTVERASFGVELPSSWQLASAPVALALKLSDRVVARPSTTMVVEAGHLDNPRSGPDPVPVAHRARWTSNVRPGRVTLGGVGALRFDATDRARIVERMYVVPTTRGYLAVSCRGPYVTRRLLRDRCDRAAATIRPRGAKAVAPGPSESTAKGVADALRALEAARGRHASGLASKHDHTRVAALRTLSRSHERASAALARVPRGPQDRGVVRELEHAIAGVGAGLARAAAALTAKSRSSYNAARAGIRHDERRVARARTALAAAGYTLKRSD